jgi:dipeptidase E
MKLLLTSGGVSNASIRDALVGLLGKPIADCTALCIPTAEWGQPMCTPPPGVSFPAILRPP